MPKPKTDEQIKNIYLDILDYSSLSEKEDLLESLLKHMQVVISTNRSSPEKKTLLKSLFCCVIEQVDREQPAARALQIALGRSGKKTFHMNDIEPVEQMDINSICHFITQLLALAHSAEQAGIYIQIYKTDLIDVLKRMNSEYIRYSPSSEIERKAG